MRLLKQVTQPKAEAGEAARSTADDEYIGQQYPGGSGAASVRWAVATSTMRIGPPDAVEGQGEETTVVVDTGATRTMTPDERLLKDKRPLQNVNVYFGDNAEPHTARFGCRVDGSCPRYP